MIRKRGSKEMKELNEFLEIKAMADAVAESSKRSRFVIIVLVFASVLSLIGSWNSWQLSWTNCRLRMAKYALRHKAWELTGIDSLSLDSLSQVIALQEMGYLATESPDHKWALENLDSLIIKGSRTATVKGMKDSLKSIFQEKEDSLRYAVYICENRGFYSDTDLVQYIRDLDRVRTEGILHVHVPILGVMFDVNDLSVLGGLSFLLVLLWLRFSLRQELRNLRLFFEEAKDKDKFKAYYHYLATRQVLTIPWTLIEPPHPSSKGLSRYLEMVLLFLPRIFYESPNRTSRKFWCFVEKGLFFSPFIVQVIVLMNDRRTRMIGIMVGKELADRNLWIGRSLLVLIFILTVRCVVLSCQLTKEWDRAYRKIEKV